MNRQPSVWSRKLRNFCAKFTKNTKEENQNKKCHITLCLYLCTYTLQNVHKENEQLQGHICPPVFWVMPCNSSLTAHELKTSVRASTVYSSYLLYPSPWPSNNWRSETVFYSLLVCLPKDQDGLNSVSDSFSKSCLVTYKDRPGFPVCIIFILHCGHYVAMQAALCCFAGCIMLLCRLHYVAMQAVLCCNAGCIMLQCRLHYVAMQAALYCFAGCIMFSKLLKYI
jgi:hypothetical protein